MSSNSNIKIMVIDDNVTNLNIVRMALGELYELILITSGEKAISLFEKIIPDLILLDVEMPGLNGFDVIKLIKSSKPPICDIPVIFVTAKDDNNSEFSGLELGAVDYIAKPFSPPLLRKRIELHLSLVRQQKELFHYSHNLERMVDEKTRVITQLQYSIMHVLSDMVERRDGSTGGHLLRTQNYLRLLLNQVKHTGVYPDEIEPINVDAFVQASQLHDVGKMSIPDSILLKEGRLTKEEFEIMKTHTTIGENTILYAMSKVHEKEFLRCAASFAGAHHDHWDGRGYPRGLAKRDIPIEGRLMAIVDVYDALISERPYKPALSHEVAVDIIAKERETHFDPLLVDVFLKIRDEFREVAKMYQDDTAHFLEVL